MAPRLQSDRTVSAAYVTQQVVAGVRLDLDALDHGSEEQAPACMIWVWFEACSNPAERGLEYRAPIGLSPRGKRERPARSGHYAGKCVGQGPLVPPQQVDGHRSRFGQQVGQRRLLVDQPDHFPGIASGDQKRRERPSSAYAVGGGSPDADRGHHPTAETTERISVLLANCERVTVVDRHVTSSTRAVRTARSDVAWITTEPPDAARSPSRNPLRWIEGTRSGGAL